MSAELNPPTIQKISSYVFFDLETTGLPAYHPVKITELSFCAVDRVHFLNANGRKEVPRVTNRLNLCIYPSRLVDPDASEITNLDNYNLEYQSRFDENVFEVINSFLNRLKPPVCLIAHNGTDFDFPILKAEIEKLNKKLNSGLLCADSLPIFRELTRKETLGAEKTREIIVTPGIIHPLQLLNETTPEKYVSTTENRAESNCRKRLPFSTILTNNSPKRLKFDLVSIYERIFNEKPNDSHTAESDVLTLLLSAIQKAPEFLGAVDEHNFPFESVRKCW